MSHDYLSTSRTHDPMMRRVIVDVTGRVVVEDVIEPTPREGEVLVSTVVVGLCGSDVHAAAGHHPFLPLPYYPGHEVVGYVEQLGPDVTEPAVGQRVTVEPTLPCGQCKQCKNGRTNLCEALQFFGCGYSQGGMAERFTIPASRLHVVPEGLTDREAALIEPLATPVHAISLAGAGRPDGELRGATVAILGAGTIGLLLLLACRHAGARTIVVTDVRPTKRDRARRLGADAVIDAAREDVVDAVREELQESADVVFDCVSSQQTLRQAVGIAAKGGTVVVVGVPSGDVSVPLPLVQDQQVRLQGTATYLAADFDQAIQILEHGGVPTEEIITGIFPLDSAADAFEASASGEHVKVLVTM